MFLCGHGRFQNTHNKPCLPGIMFILDNSAVHHLDSQRPMMFKKQVECGGCGGWACNIFECDTGSWNLHPISGLL